MSQSPDTRAEVFFVRRVLIVAGIAALCLLAWQLADVLLLAFAATLLAILLRGLATTIQAGIPIGYGWSLALAVLFLVTLIGSAVALFGTQISAEFGNLLEQLPRAWDEVRSRVGDAAWLTPTLERVGNMIFSGGSIVNRLGGAVSTALGIVADALLVIFGALYIAAQPDLYKGGLVRLFPKDDRSHADRTLDHCGTALWYWLLGQFLAMAVVGVLTGIALAVLGVPSALALALFAAMAEFVPVVGPIVAAIPAIIIALSRSYDLAIWVALVFVVIQQVEGYIIQPLVQRRMVSLPPALLLFAILGFGFLFGGLGLLFATPLAVVTFVLLRELYVRDTLGDPVKPIHPTT